MSPDGDFPFAGPPLCSLARLYFIGIPMARRFFIYGMMCIFEIRTGIFVKWLTNAGMSIIHE